jgi:alginate O-acetyltransferase complex protein AlgI
LQNVRARSPSLPTLGVHHGVPEYPDRPFFSRQENRSLVSFNSFDYILVFLPAVFILCQLARRLPLARAPQIFILLASLFFYAWPKPFNLVYLTGSILANWLLARWIAATPQPSRKRILQLSLILNIGYLAAFKYLNFIFGNIPYLVHRHIHAPELGFPLGISFFTLTQVMYLVDCYEELLEPSTLFDHATFVSFFPYVISGPISRAKRIRHQFPALNARTGPSTETLARALYLFSLGLIKKVVLADAFSIIATYGYGNIAKLSALEGWAVVSAYALQLYFDFSGYSDMAIASALFLGIEVPRNFDAPMRSLSMIEFWQRWHITLSAFITTYLYTPILRSFRKATVHTAAVATLIAMAIAGLWHGANWTFVIFGTIHGVGLAINQYWKKSKIMKLPHWLSWLVTFFIIDLGFVFFRAPNLSAALLLLTRMFNPHDLLGTSNVFDMYGGVTSNVIIYAIPQIAGLAAAFIGKSSDQLAHEFKPSWRTYAVASACMLIAMLYLNSNVAQPFVYFGF